MAERLSAGFSQVLCCDVDSSDQVAGVETEDLASRMLPLYHTFEHQVICVSLRP